MMENAKIPGTGPSLAIFAATALPGDADYTRVLSNGGTLLARKGVQLYCLVEDGAYCRPLITAALAEGGSVILVSDGSMDANTLAKGCAVKTIPDREERIQYIGERSEALIGFPANLNAVRAMFDVWIAGGGGASGKPVALLNRNRAYEVLRGYIMDVVAHTHANPDRIVMFADTVEDLWNQLERTLDRH